MSENIREQKIGNLTIRIDRNKCIGSGNCTKVAPEVFELDADQLVAFREDREEVDEDTLIEGCDVCPVEALIAIDAEGNQRVP